jgi:sugar phosphate isomerase/epimerase
MLIGAMNHPACDVLSEIRWMAKMQLEFIDLTLEPPAAATWRVNPSEIRRALDAEGMIAVGHTAYYLPFGSPFESLRKASVEEGFRCIEAFAEIGVQWMNLHPDRHAPMHDRGFYIGRNLESLRELLEFGSKHRVGIMIENLPGDYNNAYQLAELLDPLPELGLHLDIGHANLMVPGNTTGEIMARFGHRLRHVHLHDNKGGHADLHLPLGAGNVNVRAELTHLHNAGFDGTITLEVFTPDRHHFEYSRDVLRRTWTEIVEHSKQSADPVPA